MIDTRIDGNENMFQLGVGLVAADIGDAIIIDQTTVKKDEQVEIINMSNIKARALISFVNSNIEKLIKDYRIFKLFNGDNSQKEILPAKDYLSQLTINLENANINIINIIGKGNSEGDNRGKNDEIKSSTCKFKLGGFNYNQLNTTAYKFLTICIDSLYQQAINSADQIGKQPENEGKQREKANEKANNQLIQLLQPTEKLTVVSKNLGVYAVEQEMMYRQKKLDYYLTKTNLDNSISSFSEALYPIKLENVKTLRVEFVQIFNLFLALVGNIFQDITSGYGFHRLRIFNFIIPILILNFFLALFVSYQKQKKIAHYSLYFRTREIKDENIERHTINKTYCFAKISDEIDTIQQIIFGGFRFTYSGMSFGIIFKKINVGLRILQVDYLTGSILLSQAVNELKDKKFKAQNLIFILYFKNKKDKYKKVKLNSKDFKYIINILDSRNPSHSKVGFCKDYYPRGSWSVVINPPSLSDVEKMKEVNEIDLYFIDRQQIIKGMQFKSINPIKSFLNATHLNAIGILVKPLTKILNLILKIFEPSCRNDSILLVNIFVMLILIVLIIVLVIFTLPNASPFILFFSNIITKILPYQPFVYSLILLFLIFDIFRFWLRRKVIQKKIGLALVTQKNLENAFLFCIDILIPIIELDKDNTEFILDAAEDYQVIRMIFRFEKVIGPLLISVLLPLILLT